MATQSRTEVHVDVSTLFTRIVVGVDRSPESLEAARQAAALAAPGAAVTLLATWELPPLLVGAVPPATDELDRAYVEEAEQAAAAAAGVVAIDASTRAVHGTAWSELVKEAARTHASLIAVGSHGQGRMQGILIGSTATEIVHKAPCSVLVARAAWEGGVPRRIVVGVDGSPESAAAYAAGKQLAERFGAKLWPVVAHGGDGVDGDRVAAIVDYHHEDLPDEPVHALVAASAEADLLVVGSRGLHGLKALGSVSERVAHQARCSTLIVRRPHREGEDA